jgi:hypothetical protein
MQKEASPNITIQLEYLEDYTKMEYKLNVKNVAVHQKGKLEEVEKSYVSLYQALFTHV